MQEDLIKELNQKLLEYEKRISLLEYKLNVISKSSTEIYFNGQIYDAYSKISDIMNAAEQELVVIDPYADKSVLDMISRINCQVILICKKCGSILKKVDIGKYNEQYHNLIIKRSDDFHDRYFLLDRAVLYHCGSSLNMAGKKTFSINKIEDNFVVSNFISELIKYIPSDMSSNIMHEVKNVNHFIEYY